ncbi:cortical cell-delineating protein-like [Lolium rigidum]|uniref:cortical cell-delineating protein-like n=1 Tax=Lolium rigidum TaxID=89674 RepID=UPI001F5CC86D|nr:cortical cell-delineating protein-like [Lolium rigidum]
MASKFPACFPALFLALNLLLVAGVRGQSPSTSGNPCPTNALADLKVCADVLVLLKLKINVPANQQCCPMIGQLVKLDVAACLCAAIKLSVLGIPINLPLDVPLVLNYCGRNASAAGANCS